jgi:hypothetical protein
MGAHRSAEQASHQRISIQLQVLGHLADNGGERAELQRIVSRDGDVVLRKSIVKRRWLPVCLVTW